MAATKIRITSALVLVLMLCAGARSQSKELGVISFPTSGAAAAQPSFLEGVKELHSFQFDEAALAFQKAEQIDPNFAMAFWGEAMSHNHPLWGEVDVDKAKRALEKLSPKLEGRVAKAQSPKEKSYLQAADLLFYSPGDKLARDTAYSKAMAKMYAEWPDDHEVNVLYALSILGTIRPGDIGFRRQALAASICFKVFQENPKHPGAAHFIIHAFDDPDHAILALPAARQYADIAPAAAHAVHMPSHIFVRLGMWPEVEKSNVVAYKAAEDVIARLHTPEGREDFHTLSWLEYAHLMLGKNDDAKKDVELAKQAVDRNPGNKGIEERYLEMRARYILETQKWEKIPLAPAEASGTHAEAKGMQNMPGMPGMSGGTYGASGSGASPAWLFITGYSAAKLGDTSTADQAATQLGDMAAKTAAGGDAYGAKPYTIMEKEVRAVAQLARGQKEEAARLAKEAADLDLGMSPPSGPPDPIKPATELYGEILIEAGQPGQAAAAFEKSLERTPNRTPLVRDAGMASKTAVAAKE